MILLLSAATCSRERLEALQNETGELIELVSDVGAAARSLRQREYTAIVIDRLVADAAPWSIGPLLRHARGAVPVHLNLAISNSRRLAMEIKNALRRRSTEHNSATGTYVFELKDNLRNALTGILLSSELALTVPAVPPDAVAKIEKVRELAESMRIHLEF